MVIRLLPCLFAIIITVFCIIGSMDSNADGGGQPVFQRRHNGQSLDEYRHFKLLPHISEEYEFRITNKLLVQKIANPRRDRIIIDSLAHTASGHFYKNKKGVCSHQDAAYYGRKNVLTAAHKKRTSPLFSRECKRKKQEQADKRLHAEKKLEEGLRKNYEKREQKHNRTEQDKNTDIAVSRLLDSQNKRSEFIGKIIRNNSSHLMRLPKRAILKSNYYFNNTCQQEEIRHPQIQRPQQKIRRIVKRIYQDNTLEKQNFY